MVVRIDRLFLFSTFGVSDFESLAQSLTSMAPSLVEYYLSSVFTDTQEIYINKRNIASSFYFGAFTLLVDYNEDVFLEYEQQDDYEEQSLF